MKQIAIKMFEEEVILAEKIFGVNIISNGWKLLFNKRKGSFGVCDYTKKTIFLSSYYLEDTSKVRDTLKHEIAHALCPSEGHNQKWKNTFKKLGGTGSRTGAIKEEYKLTPRYVLVNTKDGSIVREYHNKPSKDFSKCYLPSDYSTMGKLKVFTFEEYTKLYTK